MNKDSDTHSKVDVSHNLVKVTKINLLEFNFNNVKILQELFNKIRKFRKFIKSWEVGSWELLKVSINGLQNNICIEFSFNIYCKLLDITCSYNLESAWNIV